MAVLTHELRSPLNAILVWTRLLRGPNVPEERRNRALEAIERNVRHQADLLDDLVELQRIRSGRMKLDPEPVEFGSVARVVADAARREARERGVDLRFGASPEPLPVFGDPGRLQKVVRTLLVSVVRFVPEGGRVEARVGRAGNDAELVLHDPDGALPVDLIGGLAAKIRSSALRGTGGAGVALAVAEDLVHRHRGFVGVEHAGEHGLRIRVRIPLDPAGMRSARLGFLKDVRVLVVDDEPEVCRSLEALLTEVGAKVRTAVSVEQGLAAGQVDAVVTDLALPGSGYALLRAMRARHPNVPVIALTGAGVAGRGRTKFDAVLQKPVEPERLLSILLRAFARAAPPAN